MQGTTGHRRGHSRTGSWQGPGHHRSDSAASLAALGEQGRTHGEPAGRLGQPRHSAGSESELSVDDSEPGVQACVWPSRTPAAGTAAALLEHQHVHSSGHVPPPSCRAANTEGAAS